MSKAKKPAKKDNTEVWFKKELYGEAPQDYHFVLTNGEKLKDLKDLINALDKMPEDVFRHHVNEMKNDFSSWINDVFKEKNLAEELKNFYNKADTELALYKNITNKMEKMIKRLSKK